MQRRISARAVWFVGPRQVEIRPVELAEPRDGQALVRTAYSGISAGTEMLAYRGQLDAGMALDETISSLAGTFDYPFRYGYSCVGRVERAQGELTEGSLVFAFQPHPDVFVTDVRDLIELPGSDPRLATLFPMVETALQVSLEAGPVLEQPVVVVGLGAVGILTALLLQRSGARVIASEPVAWRRDVAGRLGVRAVDPADVGAHVADESAERGVPLIVEVSGQPEALAGSLRLLAHEGMALVVSWYGSKPVQLPLGADFHRRRLTLRSTQVSTIPAHLSRSWDVPRRRAAGVRLLDELPIAALATHEFAFESAEKAYAEVDRGEAGLLHAALRYP